MTTSCHKYSPPLAISVAAVFFCVSCAAKAACDGELQGGGRVAAVTDAHSFRLEDGREVRLSGIELATKTPETRFLRDLIVRREVTLHGPVDAPDRYGRQQAFVFVYGSDVAVQSEMVSQGLALTSGNIGDKACAVELAAAEKGARTARRGLWGDPSAIKNAESTPDILAEIGRFTIVEGKVVSARQAGATFYINFGRYWIRDFAVTISRRMMPSFEAAGLKLTALENKRIRVRGWVERRGGPRIEAFSPGQIELIDSN
jgi:endonuclease YncB( thermonuclease family)